MGLLSTLFPSKNIALQQGQWMIAPVCYDINFRVEPQQRTQWCWAAVTVSVAKFLAPQKSSKWTQCGLASAEFNDTCCSVGNFGRCNRQNTLDGPLNRVGHLRAPVITGYLSPAALQAELQADLPIPVRVEWGGGGGHFLSIYAIRYLPNGCQLSLTDPIYGESVIMSDALVHGGYQSSGGRWTHSYVVTP